MLQKIQEKIHSLPEAARYCIAFIAGAILFQIMYACSLGIYKISGLNLYEEKEYLVALYPVILCFISCLLNEDLKRTATAT